MNNQDIIQLLMDISLKLSDVTSFWHIQEHIRSLEPLNKATKNLRDTLILVNEVLNVFSE